MLTWPAIDLMDGRAVRLLHGRRETREEFGDPEAIAARWAEAGRAHVVDLDGAFAGEPRQAALIARLARILPIQAGGGIRHADHVAALLDAGAVRVVVGTQAFAEPGFLDGLLARFGAERIVVAADVKDGRIAARGWVDTLPMTAPEAAAWLRERGVLHALVTAVHRDGTLEGPDTSVLDVFHDAGLGVLASGGIGTLEDVAACRRYAGVIIGKALYAGRFTLGEALHAAGERTDASGGRCGGMSPRPTMETDGC
jgi:phosphoribosylformimino-5-aminoimidazole carboxamide ribotide isomerase